MRRGSPPSATSTSCTSAAWAAVTPVSLSGGQQQRVALARALATERGALLLDEPFSSLDPALRGSMHELLGEVRAALSPTVVMVTHDLDEAALADRAAVLVDGRLEQVAPVADLYRHPASLAVARLVGGFNEIEGNVVSGVHRSPWGAVDLTVVPDDGPATLLLRREDLHLTRTGTGRDAGAGAGAGAGDRLGGPGLHVPGVVAGVRQAGPRQTVTVEAAAAPGTSRPRLRIEVELPLGEQARLGERVQVRPTPGARPCAVATADGGSRPEVVRSPAS